MNEVYLELGNINYNDQPSHITYDWAVAFRSMHPGGAHFMMCYTSVRFENDDIDHFVYMARATRDGKEIEGAYKPPCQPTGQF